MPRAPRSRSSAVTTFARRVRRRHHGLPCRRWRSRPTRPCPCKAPLPRPPRRLRSPEPTLLSRDWRCSAMAPTAPRTPSRAARPRSTPSSRPTPRSWSSAQSTTWGTPTTSTLIMVRLKSSSNSPLTTLATRSSSRTMVYTRANSRCGGRGGIRGLQPACTCACAWHGMTCRVTAWHGESKHACKKWHDMPWHPSREACAQVWPGLPAKVMRCSATST
mmetsp:Transcript_20125/g.59767  ORF Transcript_20125/g.59767 Transcript_20125/m.59767 type:complete len:218 (-) Transcript_20125:1738-2391(-)